MPNNVQFVTDTEGHKTAVILPIEEYEEMMEDLHTGHAARESRGEPRRPFEEVVKELCSACSRVRQARRTGIICGDRNERPSKVH